MGIVTTGATMSLDGYIAGPDDAMDWVFDYVSVDQGEATDMDEAIMRSVGAVLSGRRCYDVGQRAARPETAERYGGRWHGPEFVLTHRPPEDDTTMFLSGDIRDAVVLAVANGDNLLVPGADVVRQCLEVGLLDEIWMRVVPILLGGGVRFFCVDQQVRLATLHVARSGPVTDLRYRVLRAAP